MRQFNDADRFDKKMRQEVERKRREESATTGRSYGRFENPLRGVFSRDDSQAAHEAIYEALTVAHSEHGIHVDYQLQHKQQDALTGQQLLIAA